MFCATKGSSPCNSTLMNLSAQDRLRLEGEERATARLHRQCQREQEGRQSERTEEGRLGLIDEAYMVRSLSLSVDLFV